MLQNVLLFIYLKCQDQLYVERYTLQQVGHNMLFCATQNNNSSLGNIHVDHIL